MSASPPATAKADIRNRSCPLYPQERTCAAHYQMSAMGQKRTSRLFDHIACAGDQCCRESQSEVFCGRTVDDQFVLGRCLYGQVTRLFALENAADVCRRLFKRISLVEAI